MDLRLFDLISIEDMRTLMTDKRMRKTACETDCRSKLGSGTLTQKKTLHMTTRAIKELPRSYKLWKLLLELRVDRLLVGKVGEQSMRHINPQFPLDHYEWKSINGQFECCLILCNKFPKIWILYCTFLLHQRTRLTFTRRTFDRALKALPITQHKQLWDLYLIFATRAGGDTAIRVWRRFLKLQPSHAERYCNMLLALNPPRTAEAARTLTAIIESPEKYANPNGKTLFEYWSLLCQLIIDHPEGIEMPQQDHLVTMSDFSLTQRPDRMDVEIIIRTGIKKFTDQVGVLWNSLARWWILQGRFDRARDVYEEGIRSITTVKDFTLLFDAYAKMEEGVLSAAVNSLSTGDGDLDEVDVDIRLARFENLMNKRPFMVNDVVLRQNPHNVQEWKNRIDLYLNLNQLVKVIETYNTACKTIQPQRAYGKLTEFWIGFAKFYEERDQLDDARRVFESAVAVPFRKVDDLAYIWCQWGEMEIRNNEFQNAVEIVGRATAPLGGNMDIRYNDDSQSPQARLFKSIRLWAFYADLEESVGSVESTKAVYDRIMELKIATPQVIINYASFLETNEFFEESFKVYERGIELFGYPVAFEIWNLYLTKFIKRYGGTKLERARDMFENALEKCPPKLAKPLYLLYAKIEEDYGLARHSLRIYDRGTQAVDKSDQYEMFSTYIAKAASFFGIVSTREIYSKALEVLPDASARDMAIQFSAMETKLGEVDRARAILAYASQLCDPRIDPAYWQVWHEFEVKYGNEDTYKEMLRYLILIRIKRSIQSKFNTEVSFITSQILAARGIDPNKPDEGGVSGFVKATSTAPDIEDETKTAANPDEIEVEDDSDESEIDDEEEDGNINLVQKSVPDTLFGGLVATKAPAEEESLGAKDRFKRKKA